MYLNIDEIHWELANDSKLSTAEIFRLLQEMHDYGVLYLTFSGSDPLQHKDFAKIYRRAHELGFLIYVNTNCSKVSSSIISLFKKCPPLKVEVSITKESNLDGIRKMNRAGIYLGIKPSGKELTKEEILAVKAYAESLPNASLQFSTLLRLSPKQILEAFHSDPELKAQLELECRTVTRPAHSSRRLFSGTKPYHISAGGELHPAHAERPQRTSLVNARFSEAANLISFSAL